MHDLGVALCLFISLSPAVGKSRKDIPPAPLPAVVVNAKKIFLTNGGGSDLAYDAFYSEMKNWGKYEIVGSPDDADLIIELSYHVEHGGTRVWSTNNTYDGTTQVHSTQIIDPQLVLTIYDAKTKNSLWETIDHRRLARREKNREKETINSAQRLVQELKTRASLAELETATASASPPQTQPSHVEQPPARENAPPTSKAMPLHPVGMTSAQPKLNSAATEKTPNALASSSPIQTSEEKGTASVTSNPDGAEIFVDTVGRGFAPALLKLSPGKHTIQLVAKGYKDWIGEIEVRSGSIVNVTGNLEK